MATIRRPNGVHQAASNAVRAVATRALGGALGAGAFTPAFEQRLAALGATATLSDDFRAFLQSHGYGELSFLDEGKPGFGGRTAPGETVKHTPVIFVHGNSDDATGFEARIQAFLDAGYRPCEVYAVSIGSADPLRGALETHSKQKLQETRKLIEAVLAYTGAESVQIEGHSLGGTVVRGAVQGGDHFDPLGGGVYDLGPSLGDKVDTLITNSSANGGLANMLALPNAVPAANLVNGLHPLAIYLQRLNAKAVANPEIEGKHRYAIYSRFGDEILGLDATRTARLPRQDGEVVVNDPRTGHLDMRDDASAKVLEIMLRHRTR